MYRIRPGQIVQKMDDKLVIFDGDSSTLYTLNETAALIFSSIKRRQPKEKISATLAKTYGIPLARAEKDVKETIASLKKLGIVVETSPQAS